MTIKKTLAQERFCTWPRFKTDACSISEVAYYRASLSPDPLNRAELEMFENGGPWEVKASRPWKGILPKMVFRKNNTPKGFTCDLQSNLDSWDEFRSENLGK